MTFINFPSSPVLNQEFLAGTRKWIWNGVYWQAISPTDRVGFTGSQGQGFTGSQGDTGFVGSIGGFESAQEVVIYNTTTYTVTATDIGKLIALSSSTVVTVTVPVSSSTSFIVGQRFDILMYDIGPISVIGDVGVTIYSPGGSVLTEQYAVASLVKLSIDEWIFVGPQAAGYTGSIGYTGSTGLDGESSFIFDADPPLNPVAGDRWYDTSLGFEFVWVADQDSGQWVEITTSGMGYSGSQGPIGYTGSQGNLPSFAGNASKVLSTDGTSTVWVSAPESGTGLNGTFLRFPDGTMMAYGIQAVTPIANSSTSFTRVLPSGFVSVLSAQVTPVTNAIETSVRSVAVSNLTTSSITLWVHRINTTDTDLSWTVYGRWRV